MYLDYLLQFLAAFSSKIVSMNGRSVVVHSLFINGFIVGVMCFVSVCYSLLKKS